MKTAVAVLVASIAVTTSTAGADALKGTGGGTVKGQTIVVGTQVNVPGSDTPIDVDGDGHTQPPLIWTTIAPEPSGPGDISQLCILNPGQTPSEFGATFRQIAVDPQTGRVVIDRLLCIPLVDGHAPPPPPPPVLPTLEEVWKSAQLPTPVIGISPAKRGITGLDTHIWTETGNTVTISVSLDGYSVTGTATVVGYAVQVDDDAATKTDKAGRPDDPIAHHLFETKGDHKVSVGVIWHGVATFDGPDLEHPITVGIGDATITATLTYPVKEVRSVLQP
jgi:hypothetical protein